jgi:hypothetical protein
VAFWKRLIPDLKVVICLRNLEEVHLSLKRRQGFSFPLAQSLWLNYYRSLLEAVPEERRIVTHYDTYFADSPGELRRLLSFLGMEAKSERIDEACATRSFGLRHHRCGLKGLLDSPVSAEALNCYMELCAEAGPIYQRVLAQDTTAETLSLADCVRSDSGYRQALQLVRLQGQVAGAARVQAQLEAQIREANQALKCAERLVAEKEENIKSLQERAAVLESSWMQKEDELTELRKCLAAREVRVLDLEARVSGKETELAAIRASRSWRLIHQVKRLRAKTLFMPKAA